MSKWFAKDARGAKQPTIYRDIFEEGSEEPIAERVRFDAAEKLVEVLTYERLKRSSETRAIQL